jgi:hypothetical protein
MRITGAAQADAVRAVGTAKAEVYRLGRDALGETGFTAMQLATILGENHVKLVPDVALGSGRNGGLADVLVARMLSGTAPKETGRQNGVAEVPVLAAG